MPRSRALRGLALAAIALLSLPGFVLPAVATSPALVALPSTASWTFTATTTTWINTSTYCQASALTVAPHFVSRTGTVHVRAVSEINTSWTATPPCQSAAIYGYAEAYVDLSAPISLSASAHNVTVNWSTTFSASESTKKLGPCPGGSRSSCYTIAYFELYDDAYLLDSSTGVVYCAGGSHCGPVLDVNATGDRCSPYAASGYLCHSPPLPNNRTSGTLNASSVLGPYTGTFNASHAYTLHLTVAAIADCFSYWWKAAAYASVNLAGKDGSTVTGIWVH